MSRLRIGLVGATGRMGGAVLSLVQDDPDITLGAVLTHGGSSDAGAGIVDTFVTDDLDAFMAHCTVVVDFSTPSTLVKVVEHCVAAGRPLVTGTTGLDDQARAALAAAAKTLPVVASPNMSIGMNILMYLTEITNDMSDSEWRFEIHECHHRHKLDAPSGSALRLGSLIERSRGAGSVQYRIEREGERVGTHTVEIHGPGERLSLTHDAEDRSIFARGALRAACWVGGRAPGLYGMAEVLGLKSP